MVRDRVRNGNAEHTHRPAATTPPERSEEEHEERSDERGGPGGGGRPGRSTPPEGGSRMARWLDEGRGSMKVEQPTLPGMGPPPCPRHPTKPGMRWLTCPHCFVQIWTPRRLARRAKGSSG
jgi:hypothetical protein